MRYFFIHSAILVLISILCFVSVIGCKPSNIQNSGKTSVSHVLTDTIVENLLVSLDTDNWNLWSEILEPDSNFPSEAYFHSMSDYYNTLGDYQSKEFVCAFKYSSGIIPFFYIAQFSEAPNGVGVNGSISNIDGKKYLHGFIKLEYYNEDFSQLRNFSDSTIESIILSIGNNDFTGYSSKFVQTVDTDELKTDFDVFYKRIKSNFGNYTSKEFGLIEIRDKYTTVWYKIKFSRISKGIWVALDIDQNNQVTDIEYNPSDLGLDE